MRNAATRVAPGGVFYLALSEKTAMSDHWIRIKKQYNRSGKTKKRLMELDHVYRHFFKDRPFSQRFESIRYIRDWLGGWPYEPSTPEEVTAFVTDEPGFEVLKVKTGEANVEYLLKKNA